MIFRLSRRTLAVLALLLPLGPLLLSPPLTAPASATGLVAKHNQLLGTEPPDHAQLAIGPAQVTLTFDLPAQRGFSTITVTGPDGHQWQAGPATEQGTTVVALLRPLGPAGDYTVAWRIVSTDGHPTRGTYQFTLTAPGAGTPAASPPEENRATLARSVWPWLAGIGALLAAGVVVAWRRKAISSTAAQSGED